MKELKYYTVSYWPSIYDEYEEESFNFKSKEKAKEFYLSLVKEKMPKDHSLATNKHEYKSIEYGIEGTEWQLISKTGRIWETSKVEMETKIVKFED